MIAPVRVFLALTERGGQLAHREYSLHLLRLHCWLLLFWPSRRHCWPQPRRHHRGRLIHSVVVVGCCWYDALLLGWCGSEDQSMGTEAREKARSGFLHSESTRQAKSQTSNSTERSITRLGEDRPATQRANLETIIFTCIILYVESSRLRGQIFQTFTWVSFYLLR